MSAFVSQEQRARTLVARLELCAHGSTTSWDSAGRGTPESRPPGAGVGREEGDYAQRSHLAFRRRLQGARTEHAFRMIADDAEAALEAWRQTPHVDLVLERTDPRGEYRFTFKRMVAGLVGSKEVGADEAARLYGVSRQTVYAWVARYYSPRRSA